MRVKTCSNYVLLCLGVSELEAFRRSGCRSVPACLTLLAYVHLINQET